MFFQFHCLVSIMESSNLPYSTASSIGGIFLNTNDQESKVTRTLCLASATWPNFIKIQSKHTFPLRGRWDSYICNYECSFEGAWVAESVKCPTLDFGSGHDLKVVRSSPKLGSALMARSLRGILSLPFSLTLPCFCAPVLFLSQNK